MDNEELKKIYNLALYRYRVPIAEAAMKEANRVILTPLTTLQTPGKAEVNTQLYVQKLCFWFWIFLLGNSVGITKVDKKVPVPVRCEVYSICRL